jgi:DNA-binding HxlR family transcriptional regulator
MPHIPPAKRHPYDQWSPDARALDLVGDKWTLLIVRDLISGPRRFVELQRVLPGISTEQLRSRLNRMVADGMLTRKRYREVPPRVDYELTERAIALAPVLGELARWGYDWAWGAPRPLEAVDIGAIFRLLPGLLAAGAGVNGRVDLTVVDGREGDETTVYTLTVADDGAQLREHGSDHDPRDAADATVRGSASAWIRALAPPPQFDGLQFSGREQLTSLVLETLSPGELRAGEAPVESAAS